MELQGALQNDNMTEWFYFKMFFILLFNYNLNCEKYGKMFTV